MNTPPISATSAEVPFRLTPGAQPLMLIPVGVNGRGPFEFILDSGAGTTLLTPALAQELSIKPTGSKQGHTAGGAVDVKLATTEQISVGDMIRGHLPVAIVDLSQIERGVGVTIRGDLGHNFFGDCRVTVDYKHHRVRFDDPKRCEYCGPAPLTEVPARLAHSAKPLIMINACVNGRGPFSFAIDTGTSTTAIAAELAQTLQLRQTPAGTVTTGGAAIAMNAAKIDSLRVGACQVGGLDVVVGGFLPMLSNVVGSHIDGVIGYNFLRNFTVVIDYPQSSFSLFAPR